MILGVPLAVEGAEEPQAAPRAEVPPAVAAGASVPPAALEAATSEDVSSASPLAWHGTGVLVRCGSFSRDMLLDTVLGCAGDPPMPTALTAALPAPPLGDPPQPCCTGLVPRASGPRGPAPGWALLALVWETPLKSERSATFHSASVALP
mmetsp:Transcript_79311/g.256817  ORF Transcript_79311/g.256817 Transcript_79311/m.256817 type:complete len:150 (+) Transcript_79311:1652-2101(+)